MPRGRMVGRAPQLYGSPLPSLFPAHAQALANSVRRQRLQTDLD